MKTAINWNWFMIVITMSDLVPEIEGKFKYCIGIENILDKEAIKNKLDNFFAEQS